MSLKVSYLTVSANGVPHLRVYVQPKASRTGFSGVHDNMLKLSITAPPVNGKANKAVIAFLAKCFGVSKKEITIVSGEKSRKKSCSIGGKSEEEISRVLHEKLQ